MNKGELNWENAKIFHRADTEVYSMKSILEDPDLLKKVEKIGESRGAYVNFKQGDEIFFPDEAHAEIYLNGFVIYNGEKRLALSCKAYTERLGYFACPMAIFRRQPLMEKLEGQEVTEYDQFTADNNLGERLLIATTDLARVQMFLNSRVIVRDRLLCHQYTYVMDEVTKKLRQDTSRTKPLICYKVAFAE